MKSIFSKIILFESYFLQKYLVKNILHEPFYSKKINLYINLKKRHFLVKHLGKKNNKTMCFFWLLIFYYKSNKNIFWENTKKTKIYYPT